MAKSLTAGSPAKLIFLFAIPLLIGNLFQQVYNMADTLIVGRTIGVDALAAVGSTGSIMFLIIGFVQAMTSGFSIPTAQYFGARKPADVRKSFCVSIILSVAVGLILTLIGFLYARDILVLMRTPPEILADAQDYVRVIFGGLGAFVAFNLMSNTILALGDSKTPLVFLVIACVINIILDFALILGAGMGVAGAAVATIIAQSVSVLLCVLYIAKKQPALILRRKDWSHVTRADVLKSLRIGIPMGFQMSIIALGTIIVQWALNSLGPIPVAAYTVAQKIDIFGIMPLLSFGLAMATYTGQNFGAGNIGRIRKGLRQCCAMSIGFSLVVGAVIILWGRYLAEAFVGPGQEAVLELSQVYLTINGSMYWVLSLLINFRYTLQGLGKSLVPTIAGIMELTMRAVAALVLIHPLGFAGIAACNPLAWIGSAIPLIVAYRVIMPKLEGVRRPDPAQAAPSV